jgi:hypothetical protein
MAEIRLGTSRPDQNPWMWWTLVQGSSDRPWPVWLWTGSSLRWRRVGAR